jgi:hypothetical protein
VRVQRPVDSPIGPQCIIGGENNVEIEEFIRSILAFRPVVHKSAHAAGSNVPARVNVGGMIVKRNAIDDTFLSVAAIRE